MARGESEWLESLKVGDEVATGSGMYGYSIRKVEKVTATQIVVEKSRFDRKSGWLKGEKFSYHFAYLQPVTNEIRREIIARHVRAKASRIDFLKATLQELRTLKSILSEIEAREEPPNA